MRACTLRGAQKANIIDTVGFISHLPHSLVDSFKSTLDEMLDSDIIVHVRDVSNPAFEFQKDTVLKVMREIGVGQEMLQNGYIEVWNKIDMLSPEELDEVETKSLEHDLFPIIPMCATDG